MGKDISGRAKYEIKILQEKHVLIGIGGLLVDTKK